MVLDPKLDQKCCCAIIIFTTTYNASQIFFVQRLYLNKHVLGTMQYPKKKHGATITYLCQIWTGFLKARSWGILGPDRLELIIFVIEPVPLDIRSWSDIRLSDVVLVNLLSKIWSTSDQLLMSKRAGSMTKIINSKRSGP